jgi:hypothetical protein
MPNITSKLGRYCVIHGYYHDEEYLECDFCNEHKWSVYFHDRYYNYGFSKCSYHACNECHDALKDKKQGNKTTTIDYYEAARIAYTDRGYMRKFIEREINV